MKRVIWRGEGGFSVNSLFLLMVLNSQNGVVEVVTFLTYLGGAL